MMKIISLKKAIWKKPFFLIEIKPLKNCLFLVTQSEQNILKVIRKLASEPESYQILESETFFIEPSEATPHLINRI